MDLEVLKNLKEFREVVRGFQEMVFKPFAVTYAKHSGNSKNMPDIVVNRAHRDVLAVSTMMAKPFTGRVAFFENMNGRRYSFYALQV